MENIIENNKKIAEFMDFKSTNKCIISESGKYFDFHNKEGFSCIKEQEMQIESEWGFGLVEQDFLFVEDLKFHSDWNWLMEVVEKIENLEHCQIDISLNWCRIGYKGTLFNYDSRDYFKGLTKIESVYNACVEFIKWYNKNK